MTATQNPLDLAIEGGNGFFRIQRANGDFGYTRAGNFRVDATGRLVTQTGEVVDPGVTLSADATGVTIRADGTVLAKMPGKIDPTEIGNLHLAMFTNPGGLEAIGNNLFGPTAASGDPVLVKPGEQGSGSIGQGYLENANVQAVQEMVDMITTQRAYEMNSKTIQTADQMLARLTQLH